VARREHKQDFTGEQRGRNRSCFRVTWQTWRLGHRNKKRFIRDNWEEDFTTLERILNLAKALLCILVMIGTQFQKK